MNYIKFLIRLADQLDNEGKYKKANIIDENFIEFLKMLENGELDFNFTYSGGSRDPRNPYSNRGKDGTPIFGIPNI